MTSIGLISDVHATPGPVAEALSIFAREGVDRVFCAGDIAGYRDGLSETVELLSGHGVHAVLGNHDLQYLDHFDDNANDPAIAYFNQLPATIDTEIDGKRLYVVHAEPPDACHGGIKLRNREGIVQADRVANWAEKLSTFEADVLVVGHTHQVFAEQIGTTLVVNPGSSAFNYSCAILRLPAMAVETFPLAGHDIKNTWNWSEHVR